jgi:hypothetical protein
MRLVLIDSNNNSRSPAGPSQTAEKVFPEGGGGFNHRVKPAKSMGL